MLNRNTIILVAIVLLGALLRLDFLLATDFRIDADEAIVGLMGKHILEGRGVPIFYYGQAYMGSLEAILASFVFGFLGVSSFALKLVPFVFSVLLIPLIYVLVRQLGESPKAALWGAVLTAVAPATFIIWGLKARGGFIEVVFISALCLSLALQILKANRLSFFKIILVGFLFGVGWWVNFQIIFFMFPIGLYLLIWLFSHAVADTKDKWKWCLYGMLAFIVGSLPFWIYNFHHRFESFNMFAGAKSGSAGEHLEGLFAMGLPILWGAKRLWQEGDIYFGSSALAYSAYLVTIVLFIWFVRKNFLDCRNRELGVGLLPFIFVFSLLVFVFSSFGHLFAEPRYLLPTYVVVFLMAAVVIGNLIEIRSSMGNYLGACFLVLNILSMYYGGRAIPGEPQVLGEGRVSKDNSELISWLEKNNYHFVRTNYWIGYRLAFETNERVRFAISQRPYVARIPEYEKEYQKLDKLDLPLVLVRTQAGLIEPALRAMGYKFRRKVLSGYYVYYKIKSRCRDVAPVPLDDLAPWASTNADEARAALDKNLETRWGSGQPQSPGMKFGVKIKGEHKVRGIKYDLGKWGTDYPRHLDIELKVGPESKVWRPYQPWQYNGIRYFMESDSSLYICFKRKLADEVVFTQQAKDPIFDWSIAEIELLE